MEKFSVILFGIFQEKTKIFLQNFKKGLFAFGRKARQKVLTKKILLLFFVSQKMFLKNRLNKEKNIENY